MTTFSQDGIAFGRPEAPSRWAVIIGINKYPFLGDADLDGSVNDAQGYKAVLQERFEFEDEQITLLLDEAATQDAILSALDRLVAAVRDGDQVVLTYSGHGRRIENPDSREADRMDETFVPADSGSGFFPNRDIRDDDFLARVLALTERGAYVTFICDCCHSSASLRDEFSTSTRGIAADRRRGAQQQQLAAPLRLSELGAAPAAAAAPRPRPATVLRRERYVYVAACRDSEQATEHIEQSESGPQVHGALSFYLQRELFAARPGESMQQVIERAFAALSAECPAQHPRAEGALAEAPLFIADRHPAAAGDELGRGRVLVMRRSEKSVVLSAGRLHGETCGSRYTIYPPALLQRSGHGEVSLGLVEVTAVNATTLSARILGESSPGAIVVGCLAVEVSHSTVLPPLRLELAPTPEYTAELADLSQRLASQPAIQLVQGSSAQLRVYALAPRSEPSGGESAAVAVPTGAVPQLGALSEPVWALVGRDGRLRAPPLPLRGPGDVVAIAALLSSLSTYQMVLGLEQRASPLRAAVRAVLHRRPAGAADWLPVMAGELASGGLALAEVGDELSLTLVLSPAESSGAMSALSVPIASLHVAVLYLSASGEVQVWSSDPENPPQLSAGREFVLGRRPSEQRRLGIAPGFPPPGWESEPTRRDLAAAPVVVAATDPTLGGESSSSAGPPTSPAAARPRVQDLVKIFVSPQPLQASFELILRAKSEAELARLRPSARPARVLLTALRGRKLRRSSSALSLPSLTGESAAAEQAAEDWAALSLPLIVQRQP